MKFYTLSKVSGCLVVHVYMHKCIRRFFAGLVIV